MSVYTNNYTPPPPPPKIPQDIHLHTPPEEYDFNYIFPVQLLKSNRVELRPLVPSLHARLYCDGIVKYPQLFRWLPMFPAKNFEEVLVFIEKYWRLPPDVLSYAIFTEPPWSATKVEAENYVFAGTIAMINSSEEMMMAELGFVAILPPFQRTHVHTHATALLMHRVLDLPSAGGLGLRRCQWQANSLNLPSQAAALLMGFLFEGVQKSKRVLAPGKEGARRGRRVEGVEREGTRAEAGNKGEEMDARDDWVADIDWEGWEDGGREVVDGLMARRG
ncbi:hypothetical protein L202_03870 [Cryptococcus amylolentus CBS 6039]|uniref:N-acetyltransferase domain-containing protein n=1 Tax=Cryptococcus amylolentus CBS 6039 TaxID=1295533 RepID=A0A1E3HV27_9TREE|nr:hypothetical protein L202_03870 [Cryptococcus amylolentus CBS 6039]ODN80005.1 hypothetical protein L202_03870 [Cryptococcus amylolentus CBS 6039]